MYRYPFTPFPNGWYRVAYSEEVLKGALKRVKYLNQDLLIFRGQDGKANIIDAYCPHLGADLGVNGKVIENTVACPFHGWRFDGEGDCVEIPYCSSIPKKAKLRSWPVLEQDGVIMFWYHAENKAPEFTIPDGPFRKNAKWNRPLHFSWRVRMHIQEVAENAVDTSHFPVVHAYANLPEIKNLDTNGPTFTVKLEAQRFGLNFIGKSPMTISYTGMGIVHANLTTKLFGRLPVELSVILTTTPIDEEHCEIKIKARHRKSWNPLWDLLLRPMMKKEIATDFESDIPIWEAKKYYKNPALCKDDGPIGAIRKWAKQFYSEYQSANSSDVSLRHIQIIKMPEAA